MVFKQIKLITNTTIRNLYMQARKQNSNNAKDKLKLFEILQNKEKKRKHRKFISKINAYPEHAQ